MHGSAKYMKSFGARANVLFLAIILLLNAFLVLFYPTATSAQTLPACVDGQFYSRLLSDTDLSGRHYYDKTTDQECAPSQAQKDALPWYGIARPVAACNLTAFSFELCIIEPLMSYLTSFFVTFGAAMLLIAGTMFDFFVQLLVVEYGQTLNSLHIMEGIEMAWTLFRDLSNIFIIGIFTFVAIMTILGSAEYGAKHLVARVLIVAVLINFSLLFSKMIIDGSNFVAYSISRSLPVQAGSTGTADSFLQAFGIQNVWTDTDNLLHNVGQSNKSALQSVFYGIVLTVILCIIAAVLIYGIIIIAARALLLVFAMLVSALAFASYMLPGPAKQNFIGWEEWWKMLLKGALFGPLLMFFLWITMVIITRAAQVSGGSGKAIGQLASTPENMTVSGWQSIIMLLIGTGILFVGIRSASSFSSRIAGFNWAQAAAASPFSFASRLPGFAMRQGLGRFAASRVNSLEGQIADYRRKAMTAKTEEEREAAEREATRLAAQKAKWENTSKRTFELTQTQFGKKLNKMFGVPGFIAGGKVESFGKRMEDKAKAAQKIAEEIKPTGEDKRELREKKDAELKSAREVARQKHETEQEAAEAQLKIAHDAAETTRKSQAEERQRHEQEKHEARREQERIREESRVEIERLTRQASKAANESEKQRLLDQAHSQRKTRDERLREQDTRIERAQKSIGALEHTATESIREAQKSLGEIAKRRQAFEENNSDKRIKERVDATIDHATETMQQAAEDAAARYTKSFFGRVIGTPDGVVANKARSLTRKTSKDKREGGDLLRRLRDMSNESGGGEAKKEDGSNEH